MDIRIATVTGSTIATSGNGTEPGRVLQAVVTDVHDTQSVHTQQAGDEYNPPNGATVIIAACGNSHKVALAYDDGIAPVMEKGGRRIYATGGDGAAEVAEVRLHPDGAIAISNGAGGATLSPAGVWTFHGTASHFDHPVTMAETLEVTGAVSSDVSVTAPQVAGTVDVTFAGKSTVAHKHGGTTPYTTVPV